MPPRGGQQLVLSGRTGKFDSPQNAAAGSSNLLIGGAGDALFELRGAIAGEDQVGVRVNKAGRHAAPLGVDHSALRRNAGADFRIRSSGCDAALFDKQCGIRNQSQLAQFRTCARARRTRKRYQLTDIDNGKNHGLEA